MNRLVLNWSTISEPISIQLWEFTTCSNMTFWPRFHPIVRLNSGTSKIFKSKLKLRMDSSSLSFPWEDTLGHLTPLQEWRWVVNSLLKPAQDWSLQEVKMVMSESGASLTFLKTKSSQPQMVTTFASECGAKTKIPSFSLTITASYLFSCASKTTQKLSSGTVKKSLKVRKL